MTQPLPRYRLIACEVMFRECAAAMANCKAIVDPEFLPKGLHDIGEAGMCSRIQSAIDATDPTSYDAILLAYGLCNNGVRGLHATRPLVLPRAHDCITLLLGSRHRYAEYFAANPGKYMWDKRFHATVVSILKPAQVNTDEIRGMFSSGKTPEEILNHYNTDPTLNILVETSNFSKGDSPVGIKSTSVGNKTGKSFSGTGTIPHLSQCTTGIGSPQYR